MSILNVNQIQPVGSGQTVTISAANITASSSTITASSFVGGVTVTSGNLTGISSVSTTNLTVNGNAYPATGPLSNRNLIINGAMQVAQRGTSTTAPGYLLDRFYFSTSGATGTYSQESFTIGQTDVPGADKYLKLDITTGDNNSGIYHKIEAKNAFSAIGGKVTLSYYAKGTSPTGGLQVGILWYDGSTSSSRADTTVTLTSSWVKYTHTFDVPSISGLTLTNASAYLEVHWQQASTDTGTAAYQLQLAQVQLEVGTVATPFEHRSYGQELALCQRYYYKLGPVGSSKTLANASADSATAGWAIGSFPVTMRTSPTALEQSGTASDYVVRTGGVSRTCSAVPTFDNATTDGWMVALTVASGQTAGQAGFLRAASVTTAYLAWSAEL